MGICLGAAMTAQRRAPVPIAAAAAIVGFGLLVVAGWTGIHWVRVLMWGIPAALLVFGCVFLEREVGPWLARLPLLTLLFHLPRARAGCVGGFTDLDQGACAAESRRHRRDHDHDGAGRPLAAVS
jgi:hypothetical protein